MVRTIPHRELRNDSSRILEEVRSGETIHITNHGEIVATLVPPQTRPALTRRPARTRIPWTQFEVPPADEGELPITQEHWDDVREERG
ncbi:type II toxin-antitoxin system Phd/YefM family antitoxin [Microbacterium sp. No. 7]|uniref:type II toxin-antitoxin system Phd/YefM family antitoxin n=1 Tax=Microbacterium sp. No. 7 TaxID=1714373 RepID=UPI0006CF68DF|nr:type II toxin-antitoxin system prevent-host-death family antitoxin [Microbacterium sp. No. 7]